VILLTKFKATNVHFQRATAYIMLRVLYAIAVRLSVCHTGGSVKNGWSWDFHRMV